jgi:hypothetical protein
VQVMARPDEASPIGNKTASVAAVPRDDSGPSPNRPAARGAQLQQRKSLVKIADGELDALLFLWDPLAPIPTIRTSRLCFASLWSGTSRRPATWQLRTSWSSPRSSPPATAAWYLNIRVLSIPAGSVLKARPFG